MTRGLTPRQRNILEFIVRSVRDDGFPPTIAEIGDRFGISSTNGVNDHLVALERKGFIERSSKARSIRVTEMAAIDLFEDEAGMLPLLGRVAAGQPLLAVENIDMTANVLRAARERGARRVVFASSNWVMAGYRFAGLRITPELPPQPLNPYGVSKLAGERMGRDAAAQGVGFIALRIGWNQPTPGNLPGPHMTMGAWGQQMWLSDRDLCQGFERAVLAEGVDCAVLHLMSDNPGMPWDIETTQRVIGYAPRDGWTAVLDAEKLRLQDLARRSRALAAELENEVMQSRW